MRVRARRQWITDAIGARQELFRPDRGDRANADDRAAIGPRYGAARGALALVGGGFVLYNNV